MAIATGTLDEKAERDLIVRAKKGDGAAFSALTRVYIRRVYRAAYAVVRNHADAEDVAQETFVRAYQSIARFDETRPMFPWLYRIARNLCINRVQRVNNRESELPEYDHFPDRSAGPETATIAADERTRIRAAVRALPENYRRIIELSHFQECSYREIADILEIPIGTVMSRLYHARRKLKELLEHEGG